MADNGYKINKSLNLNPQVSAPANPVDGDFYYDSTAQSFAYYHNGSWANFDSVGTVASTLWLTSTSFTPTVVRNSVVKVTGGTTPTHLAGMSSSFSAKRITIYNAGTDIIIVEPEDANELTSNNRIVTPTGGSMNLIAGEVAVFTYDVSASRWLLVSISSQAGAQVIATTVNPGLVTLHQASLLPLDGVVLSDGDLNTANGVVGLDTNRAATIAAPTSAVTALTVTAAVGANAVDVNGALSMQSNQINNLADPTAAQDALTKNFFDVNEYAEMNWVINGDFAISQRFDVGSLPYTGNGVSSGNFTDTRTWYADRWYAYRGTANVGLWNNNNQIGRSTGNADTSKLFLVQEIKREWIPALRGKYLTLSFMGSQAVAAGTFSARLVYGTGAITEFIQGATGAYTTGNGTAINGAPVYSTTPTLYSYTAAAVLPDTATCLAVIFDYTPSGVASAGENMIISNVMLNIGTTARTFKLASAYRGQTEVELCLPYYEKQASFGTFAPNTAISAGGTFTLGSHIVFKTPKQKTPSVYVGYLGTLGDVNIGGLGATNIGTSYAIASKDGALLKNDTVGTITPGTNGYFYCTWAAEAEI